MIILDSDLHVKSANKSYYKKFIVGEEETVGCLLFDIGEKQWDIPDLRKQLLEVISKNTYFENFEVKCNFSGVGEKIMLLNAKQIIQKTHREKLILLAVEDITEHARYYINEKELLKKDIGIHLADKAEMDKAVRQRTKQLSEKNRELENANKDLTSFTYVSSHDLQEPLRKIRNFVSVLLAEEMPNLSDTGKHYLQRTYETAQRMQALIEDLLTYSRTASAERKFIKTQLNTIVDDVKKDYEELTIEKNATIEVDNLYEAKIIGFQFRQVIYNLIGNSLKFSKPKKAPHITIKGEIIQGNPLIHNKLSEKSEYCHIIFTDNGIGFDSQYSERIFEVFQRLHGSEVYKGTGMGLAICKRIIENHHGVITAQGKVNKGARFDIYLPT